MHIVYYNIYCRTLLALIYTIHDLYAIFFPTSRYACAQIFRHCLYFFWVSVEVLEVVDTCIWYIIPFRNFVTDLLEVLQSIGPRKQLDRFRDYQIWQFCD